MGKTTTRVVPMDTNHVPEEVIRTLRKKGDISPLRGDGGETYQRTRTNIDGPHVKITKERGS